MNRDQREDYPMTKPLPYPEIKKSMMQLIELMDSHHILWPDDGVISGAIIRVMETPELTVGKALIAEMEQAKCQKSN